MRQLFTRANAAEMARRATRARLARIAQAKERAAQAPQDATEQARIKRVVLQLEAIDALLSKAKDALEISRLAQSKEKLWGLIYTSPGRFKPRAPKPPNRPAIAMPISAADVAEPVPAYPPVSSQAVPIGPA